MRYTVVLVPEEGDTGRYVAYVPAIPGCVTYGNSIEHALEMAKDAAIVTIEGMIEDGDEVLAEPSGAVIASITVDVPALTTALA